mmetsp:Transcript_82422/g.238062  ORF Transcript_82422/g.238062 Transcript_82422/m.238062 type:complete len:204 (+) Transcript_82422:1085-1696(+)
MCRHSLSARTWRPSSSACRSFPPTAPLRRASGSSSATCSTSAAAVGPAKCARPNRVPRCVWRKCALLRSRLGPRLVCRARPRSSLHGPSIPEAASSRRGRRSRGAALRPRSSPRRRSRPAPQPLPLPPRGPRRRSRPRCKRRSRRRRCRRPLLRQRLTRRCSGRCCRRLCGTLRRAVRSLCPSSASVSSRCRCPGRRPSSPTF